MRYTVLFCSNTGAKRVKPGQARSGSHARRPTPRRLSVFCSTTLDIRISHAHAEPVFEESGHSANNPTRQAGEVQCLGEMPSVSRATALRPDTHQVRQTQSSVKTLQYALAPGESAVASPIQCNPGWIAQRGLKFAFSKLFDAVCDYS